MKSKTKMKIQSTLLFVGSCTLLALVPFLAASQTPTAPTAQAPAPTKITGKTLMAFDELKWMPMPGLDGAQQALLWGDPTKGAHRILYKWAAGTKAPAHTHTNGDRGLIVSGMLSLAVEGAAPKKLPPGSFFSLAGGVKHITAVEGDAPCVFYIEREGPFDAVMVK
jgi:quercetin dioxygenase-like cupin family protein